MTQKDRQYYASKISALRKALEGLESELGAVPAPARTKKPNLMQHFADCYAAGTWRKPDHLKKKSIKK